LRRGEQHLNPRPVQELRHAALPLARHARCRRRRPAAVAAGLGRSRAGHSRRLPDRRDPRRRGQSVHLSATPIAVTADLSRGYVNLTEGKIALNVTLSPAAAKRMRDYTAGHVGQGIAYIVDDHAVQVLRVRDPVLASGILIGGVSKTEADRIAAGINARLPACR
jgi:preprotein translocase subunit SecD